MQLTMGAVAQQTLSQNKKANRSKTPSRAVGVVKKMSRNFDGADRFFRGRFRGCKHFHNC
jgi:hypothetical protein